MTAMLNEHVRTALAYKAQKKQKPRPPKPGFEDSPGEHADMEAMDKAVADFLRQFEKEEQGGYQHAQDRRYIPGIIIV
jgi:hypothetical protein